MPSRLSTCPSPDVIFCALVPTGPFAALALSSALLQSSSADRYAPVQVNTDKGRIREANLTFLDFLEALTRIAGMKALPTDEEIEAAGCSDAFHFLSQLKATDEERYKGFLRERRTAWGDEPSQPMWRCVAHLCGIIVHTIEENSAGTDNMELTEAEVKNWVQRSSMVAGK